MKRNQKVLYIAICLLACMFVGPLMAGSREIIKKPGTYVYGINFEDYDPNTDNSAIIRITSSNVEVDFAGHRLSQKSTNTLASVDAIYIEENLSHITVKNASIADMNGVGVYVSDGCSDINLDNILIMRCDESGMLLDGSSTGTGIVDCTIKNCLVMSCTGGLNNLAYGLRMVSCKKVKIEDSVFNGNDTISTGTGYGVRLESCERCELVNCRAQDNGGDLLGVGFSFYQTDFCTIENCEAIYNISRDSAGSSRAVGFLFDQADGNIIQHCKSMRNTNAVAIGRGFEAINGSSNVFHACSAENNTGNTTASGFYLGGTEQKSCIAECDGRGNDGTAGTGYGIWLDGASNCDVRDNSLVANIGASGVGLKDSTNNTTNLIAANYTFVNTTTGYEVTRNDGGALPVMFAGVGDFSAVGDANKFYNIAVE